MTLEQMAAERRAVRLKVQAEVVATKAAAEKEAYRLACEAKATAKAVAAKEASRLEEVALSLKP